MKLESGPHIQMAKRDQRIRKITPDWQVAVFISKGNLHTRLVIGGYKNNRALHPPSRILKVHIEALMGFRHVYSPDGLNNIILSGCFLEVVPSAEAVSEMYIPRRE